MPYCPGSRNRTIQFPRSFVLVCCVTPVSSEITETSAPGITAPCGSNTRPPRDARLSWPEPRIGKNNTIERTTATLRITQLLAALSIYQRDFVQNKVSDCETYPGYGRATPTAS